MQTELTFTLPKNDTKPNPFEIIPLQTTRKENNWKTEEAFSCNCGDGTDQRAQSLMFMMMMMMMIMMMTYSIWVRTEV